MNFAFGGLKVFIGRMPRRMAGGDVELKRFALRDLPFVRQGLHDEGWRGSAFATWWHLRRFFSYLYLIEIGGRPAGIFGISDFVPGVSAAITLVLFDRALRRRGYGKETVALATVMLQRHASVKRLTVLVDPENPAGLAFWKALGFREDHGRGGNKVLCLGFNLDRG